MSKSYSDKIITATLKAMQSMPITFTTPKKFANVDSHMKKPPARHMTIPTSNCFQSMISPNRNVQFHVFKLTNQAVGTTKSAACPERIFL